MSELEKAEAEARKWMREGTPISPNSLYWSRVLSERDVLKGQLDAMEEALAEKDARIAELERDISDNAPHMDALRRAVDYVSTSKPCARFAQPGARLDECIRSIVEGYECELRARPVVESDEARRLREAWEKAGSEVLSPMIDGWEMEERQEFAAALRAFCESSPPASLPVREVVVESAEARTLRERAKDLSPGEWIASIGVGGEDRGSNARARFHEALSDFVVSIPPASAPSDEALAERVTSLEGSLETHEATARGLRAQLSESLTREAKLRADLQLERDAYEICRSERTKLRADLAALKSAPVRCEREVDAELRKALEADADARMNFASEQCWSLPKNVRIARAIHAWLAAPLAAPADDEYTRAAVVSSELAVRWNADPNNSEIGSEADRAWAHFRKLYAARQRAPIAPKVEPAQADGERVTVYVRQLADGRSGAAIWSHLDKERGTLAPGESWLAIDARRVREGGA